MKALLMSQFTPLELHALHLLNLTLEADFGIEVKLNSIASYYAKQILRKMRNLNPDFACIAFEISRTNPNALWIYKTQEEQNDGNS